MEASKSFDPHHARVLVVGPMAVGKTTLVNALCYGCDGGPLHGRPAPTVGCNVDVKLLAGGSADRFVEFWDVGGNPDAASTRGMFFEGCPVAGVILVYDLSNPRSLRELRGWTEELDSAGVSILPRSDRGGGFESAVTGGSTYGEGELVSENVMQDLEGGLAVIRGTIVPLLVVGNKADAGEGVRCAGIVLAAELGAAHVAVSARELGSESQEPFERFFDRLFRHHAGQMSPSEAQPRSWTSLRNDISRTVGFGEGEDLEFGEEKSGRFLASAMSGRVGSGLGASSRRGWQMSADSTLPTERLHERAKQS